MSRADGRAAGAKTRFTSTNQPSNRGRRPSQVKAWETKYKISSSDYIALFTDITAYTLDELEVMVNEENKGKLPAIKALCISAFLHDMKTGTLTSANTVLDRIMGKPTQQVNFGGGDRELPTDPRERAALAERLRQNIVSRGARDVAEPGEKAAPAKAKKPKEKKN